MNVPALVMLRPERGEEAADMNGNGSPRPGLKSTEPARDERPDGEVPGVEADGFPVLPRDGDDVWHFVLDGLEHRIGGSIDELPDAYVVMCAAKNLRHVQAHPRQHHRGLQSLARQS